MTKFLDGPAKGAVLLLQRAPHFLRVVQAPGRLGKTAYAWDALDLLDDQPRPEEHIVVYVMVGEPTWMHVNRGRKGSGVYRGADYQVVDPQPTDAQVRTTAAWQAWVAEQVGSPIDPETGRPLRESGRPVGRGRARLED